MYNTWMRLAYWETVFIDPWGDLTALCCENTD